MKVLIAIHLICLVIFDALTLYTVKDWSTINIISISTVNLAFIIGPIFILISPKTSNRDIFAGTTALISIAYLISAIIVSEICMHIDIDTTLATIVQAIVIVVFVLVLVMNHIGNAKSGVADTRREEGIMQFLRAEDALNEAMRKCKDQKIRKTIEKAYDACMSRTAPGSDLGTDFDNKIDKSASDILAAVKDSKNEVIIEESQRIVDLVEKREKVVRN